MNNRTQSRFAGKIRASLLLMLSIAFAGEAFAQNGKLAGQPVAGYRARRQKLMEQIKDGIVVLIGAREDEFGEVGRFRQKNDFMYLTGVETPAAYLVLVPAVVSKNKSAQETLFIPPRNLFQERWTGPQIGPGTEAEQKFGIKEVAGSDKFNERLRELLTKTNGGDGQSMLKLYTVVPTGSAAELTRESRFIETIRRDMPMLQIEDVSRIIAEMRKVKSSSEVALLQKAIDITGEAQREAARAIKPGAYEYEVQAALEAAFTRNGAERAGFPSIVGSGFNSTVLHYNENRKRIEADDTVVVDIGAEYSYYTADITRTYPASGKFTSRQREVYELVLEAQRAAERAYKPGMSIAQLNRVAIEVMKASKVRDKQGNTLDKYFIHGLGHWLGMDVHDVGSYGPMPVGSVITIEPGIYIPEEKLGVRIEDDYLVTETGLVKLSRNIPSDPDEIERLMSGARVAHAGRSLLR
ncbi:MAG TPA: aminopeptidase P N-terminal domain-containing protein [Blastocatellia bacterium]|nr:aminopeptidase P N-terminal domain-containing protein [Blastocatellia bacterium]